MWTVEMRIQNWERGRSGMKGHLEHHQLSCHSTSYIEYWLAKTKTKRVDTFFCDSEQRLLQVEENNPAELHQIYCCCSRCFMYSSKEGAAEMDLRGSSSSLGSGSRVSNMPPAPFFGGSLYKAVVRVKAGCGAKADAPATRAARRIILD